MISTFPNKIFRLTMAAVVLAALALVACRAKDEAELPAIDTIFLPGPADDDGTPEMTRMSHRFHIVEPAVPSPLPDNPKTGFILALSAILGLALGMCVAIGRHYWEASLMTVEEVERLTMLPVLGSIPLMSGGGGRRLLDAGRKLLPGNKADSLVRVVPLMPDGVTAPNLIEGVETICASLLLSQSGRPPRVLLVTSSVAGEGKTTVACQIARTFAQGGAKTLLVDCDLRRPQLDKVLGIGNDAGLALYLSGHMGPKPTVHMTEQENLFCVVAGPRAPNPPALLGSENMADFLRLMADTHQFVVIDSAPILPVADARVLARAVDGVILVVRAGAAPSPIVKRVTSILESVQAPLLGFVLNGAESLGFRSQYSRYYGD